jgi:kumamolisin
MTRGELARYGATPSQLERVRAFARAFGLKMGASDLPARTVSLSGTVAQMEKAFGVPLERFRTREGQTFRASRQDLRPPASVAADIQAVLGLNDAPRARHYRHRSVKSDGYTPRDVADLYRFPSTADGNGQTIALIQLGGGYHEKELDQYFKELGLERPRMTAVGIDGAHNKPDDDPDGDDGEVVMDAEIAGAVAPGAHLVTYFAPNQDRSFLNAIKAAIHSKKHPPNAISISWGSPEEEYARRDLDAFEDAFHDAAALGINVFTAAGDDSSSDGVNDGRSHMDYPGSSRWAISCGGTTVETASGALSGERVWNRGPHDATGGGVSHFFDLPPWQRGFPVPLDDGRARRGAPDISVDSDPETGYRILVDGQRDVSGGTSAAAPLLAGLAARLGQALGQPIGFLGPIIYSEALRATFHDITAGDNGAFKAAPGWDAASGLGSPDGERMLDALRARVA